MAEGNQRRLRPCSVLLSIQVEKALKLPFSMPKTMITLLLNNHPRIPRTQGIKPDLYAPATEASKVQSHLCLIPGHKIGLEPQTESLPG